MLTTDELGHLFRYIELSISIELTRNPLVRAECVDEREREERALWHLAVESPPKEDDHGTA